MSPISAAYRWNIMLLLVSSQAIAYIDRVNLSVVGPELVKVHHYSPALLGLLFSIFNWTFTLSLLFAGPFTDWVRPRVSYPLGVGTWSLASFCLETLVFCKSATVSKFPS